jgi:hypothetical protein
MDGNEVDLKFGCTLMVISMPQPYVYKLTNLWLRAQEGKKNLFPAVWKLGMFLDIFLCFPGPKSEFTPPVMKEIEQGLVTDLMVNSTLHTVKASLAGDGTPGGVDWRKRKVPFGYANTFKLDAGGVKRQGHDTAKAALIETATHSSESAAAEYTPRMVANVSLSVLEKLAIVKARISAQQGVRLVADLMEGKLTEIPDKVNNKTRPILLWDPFSIEKPKTSIVPFKRPHVSCNEAIMKFGVLGEVQEDDIQTQLLMKKMFAMSSNVSGDIYSISQFIDLKLEQTSEDLCDEYRKQDPPKQRGRRIKGCIKVSAALPSENAVKMAECWVKRQKGVDLNRVSWEAIALPQMGNSMELHMCMTGWEASDFDNTTLAAMEADMKKSTGMADGDECKMSIISGASDSADMLLDAHAGSVVVKASLTVNSNTIGGISSIVSGASTLAPVATSQPTVTTPVPSATPTLGPSSSPSLTPTVAPSTSNQYSSTSPTMFPSLGPTGAPSLTPSDGPSLPPTSFPTLVPTTGSTLDCPGGNATACVSLCNGTNATVFKACVDTCDLRCTAVPSTVANTSVSKQVISPIDCSSLLPPGKARKECEEMAAAGQCKLNAVNDDSLSWNILWILLPLILTLICWLYVWMAYARLAKYLDKEPDAREETPALPEKTLTFQRIEDSHGGLKMVDDFFNDT